VQEFAPASPWRLAVSGASRPPSSKFRLPRVGTDPRGRGEELPPGGSSVRLRPRQVAQVGRKEHRLLLRHDGGLHAAGRGLGQSLSG